VLDFDGVGVISHEILGGADAAEIARALAPLADVEVDVVVTARDLGRQATAHWQEEVKLGDARSFAEFERTQFRADVAEGERPHFWHAQDYAAALRRWSALVPAEHVHLVVAPRPGAPVRTLWQRYAEACGIAHAARVVDPGAVPAVNPSLGTAAIALLRRLNADLDGALSPREHARLVKRGIGEDWLATAEAAGSPPRTPESLSDVLVPATRSWVAEIRASRHPVHGDLDELTPVLAGPDEPHPDDVPDAAIASLATAALAASVLRQAESGSVDSAHEGTGNARRPGRGSPSPGPAERLRRRLKLDRD
jgi:hypothetical protein